MQDVLTHLATAIEAVLFAGVAIAPLVHAWNRAGSTLPKSAIAVQPKIKTAPVQPKPEEVNTLPDPWELPAEPIATVKTVIAKPAPVLYLLPAAKMDISELKDLIDLPDWKTMTPQQLRKECQSAGIKWRNAKGKNKHLSKAEMIAELEAEMQVA